ncbi:MAG TPA: hypothetical protein VNR65_07575, partial [Geobacterales bacterium]|nr:hypothetical protein [Geobacterales bacterium]
GATRISGISKFKRRVDAEPKRKLGQSSRPWRNHDLRRTMSTHMRDFLGVEKDVVELISKLYTRGPAENSEVAFWRN